MLLPNEKKKDNDTLYLIYTHAIPDDAEVVNKNNFSSAQNL